MKIVFEPNTSNSNTYVDIITTELRRAGINTVSLSSILKNLTLFREVSVVHLNWFENVGGKSAMAGVWSFFKKKAKLTLLILSGKKIIWTFHNKKPHDQKSSYLSKYLMSSLAKHCHSIIIHSKDSRALLIQYYGEKIGAKITYTPHPNYIDVYGSRELASRPNGNAQQLSLLFLGAVKPYKNIELLIEVIKSVPREDVHLTIVGKAFSNAYAASLIDSVAKNNNIILKLKFINDEDIASTIAACELLVLPYDIESSLNSGTAILAFSYGKTVICPKIGTITDYPDNKNILSYDYQNAASHAQALGKVIQKAVQMKKQDSEIFSKLGENMYNQVALQNNKTTVAEGLTNIYQY